MKINQYEESYDNFKAISYLEEFYLKINDELKFSLNFFHEVYSNFNKNDKLKLLEIGGGPTIYQLISASLVVDEIVFSDYLENNRLEVEKWIKNKEDKFNWEEYFKYVTHLNRDVLIDLNSEKLEELVRFKIKKVIHSDVYNKNPISPLNEQSFDILSVNFCLESITDKEENFLLGLNNILNLLKDGGTLILSMLKNVNFYNIGINKYHVFSIDELYIKEKLILLGYSDINIQTLEGTEFSYGEGNKEAGIISLVATKKKANL